MARSERAKLARPPRFPKLIALALEAMRGKNDDPVFPAPRGGMWDPRNLLRAFDDAQERVNAPKSVSEKLVALNDAADEEPLPELRFHDLRHTMATLLLRANVHPKVASERLGHSSIRMTLDTYSHAIPTMQTEAADVLGDLLAFETKKPHQKPTKPNLRVAS